MVIQPLLTRIGVAQSRLVSQAPAHRCMSAYLDMELLSHSLRGVHMAVMEAHRQQEAIFETTQMPTDVACDGLGLSSTQTAPITFAIDAFFDSARRAQNGIVPYLTRVFRRSLPQSLNEIAEKISSGRLSIHESIDSTILSYWADGGKELKAYRDLAQHYALVSSDALLIRSASGKVALSLFLISNPETKAATEVQYGEPAIHAIPYIRTAYIKLLIFIELTLNIIENIIPPEAKEIIVVSPFRRTLSGIPGHTCFSASAFEARIAASISGPKS